MAFDFGSPDDSSDNDGAADISAWQTGASKKRSSPPRRTSGFQAVNRPADDDIAMQSTPTPEPEPAPVQRLTSVARMQPATEATIISSGEESSSNDEENAPIGDAPIVAAPEQNGDMEDDVWAAVDEVIEDFSVLPENEDSPTHVADDASEDREPSTHTQSAEVVIPRYELDDEERADFVDLTARAGRVRRVSNERAGYGGTMQYTVTFEDYHTEQVRLTCEITVCM
jgi:hypothetical protein